MKTRHNIFTGIALLAFPLLAFFSCSDKEDVPQVKEEPSELVIGQKKVDVVVGKQVELEIVEGNNDYRAFSLNEEIATVDLTGSKLVIDAVERGNTAIIVSDASGQYRSVVVTSYHESIAVKGGRVDFRLPLGTTKTKHVRVLQGNGGYLVESSDPEIVSVQVSGEVLLLTASQEGNVDITVTDARDVTATIPVNVTSTTEPYDDDELEEIMALNTRRYIFEDNFVDSDATGTGPVMLQGMENGRNLYGWDYYGFYYLRIYFAGDKSVGKKENASLTFNYWPTSISSDEVDFEIIKNDGEKIWAIYSFVRDERLYYGYFIQNINP